ncbi:MAG: fatty acyl-AMP ligase, partial [Caulobacteraceae bacterium]|nr:fatty acyl-AMP ligase [Caulobacteraceae bacterium]
MVTPTESQRAVRHADFPTLTAALDFAAGGATGINLHDLRGKFVEALTYAALREQALEGARRLAAAGLKRGDRAALIAETDGDFVRAFFACQYAGVIPAPLPLPAPLGGREAYVEQVGRMIAACEAQALIGPSAMVDWLREAPATAGLAFVGDWAALPAPAGDAPAAPQPDDPSYLQFSSGSTRFPTGVLVTHRALMANAVAITRDGLKVTAKDRAVSWLPLYHDMGLIGFLLSPLASQMTVDLLPTGAFVRRPLLWLELITRNGGTISYSPTFGYELCARRAATASLEGYDLAGWRVAGVGGDMVRATALEDFAGRFAAAGFDARAFVASYGMAEATLALTMSPLGRGLETETLEAGRLEQGARAEIAAPSERTRRFARCGPALPHHALEARDAAGRPLGERQVGRIFARGPSLMREYYRQPEETAAALADGWLDTGDLGYLVDGELVITGRAKDLIILNGRNIWPQDLEWTAEAEVAGLRSGDVAAFAVASDEEDEVVVLVQTRTSDPAARAALAEEVAALLRQRHSIEPKVAPVGAHALPQTSSGKLSRAKARALYLAGAFEPETV